MTTDYELRPPDLAGGEVVGGGGEQLTQDQVDSFPVGVDANNQLVSENDNYYTSDMSTIGIEWTKIEDGANATVEVDATTKRARFFMKGGTSVYPSLLLNRNFSLLPVTFQAYIKNVGLQDDTGLNLLITGPQAVPDFVGAGYQQTSTPSDIVVSFYDSTAFPPGTVASGLWLRCVFLGPIVAVFVFIDAVGSTPPTESQWVEKGTRAAQVVNTKWIFPARLKIEAAAGGAYDCTIDVAHVTIKSGV